MNRLKTIHSRRCERCGGMFATQKPREWTCPECAAKLQEIQLPQATRVMDPAWWTQRRTERLRESLMAPRTESRARGRLDRDGNNRW